MSHSEEQALLWLARPEVSKALFKARLVAKALNNAPEHSGFWNGLVGDKRKRELIDEVIDDNFNHAGIVIMRNIDLLLQEVFGKELVEEEHKKHPTPYD